MPKIDDELIGTAEAATILGRDRRTVQRHVLSGALVPAHTLPGRTGAHLFRRGDVLALAEAIAERAKAKAS
tara:strand:+ start:3010 stop:3222 length:213 start_codon:yes stop_codon:yes gene_type:complete